MQPAERPADTAPVPSNLDWNLCLGAAPERPFHSAYHPFQWRGWFDFGTGARGDMAVHNLDPAGGRFVQHVHFKGLAFHHGQWLTPAGGYGPARLPRTSRPP